jgi:hypothetical protein
VGEFSPEEVRQVGLLVLRLPLDPEFSELMELGEPGTEWLVKEEVAGPGASVRMRALLPMLLLRAEEVASILEILRSMDSEQALQPIRLTQGPLASFLAVRVELERLL